MFTKHRLLQGAAILTAAGLASRLMGFFFRIFLSHAFGEESVGLYQLIFPVYALCLSVSTAGIQTAVSRMTAEKVSLGQKEAAGNVLRIALCLTLLLSLAEVLLIQQNAGHIAETFLEDPRCTEMLLIISYALPCAAVHSCICGYSFGMQRTELPAASQLIEQTARILFVVLLFIFMKDTGRTPSIKLAAAGIAAGEFASAVFSSKMLSARKTFGQMPSLAAISQNTRELLTLSLPLTANRAAVTLLQSVEAASIPASLKLYGLDGSTAISTYGVLTGMALPCILFPSAITNSVGTVLLPAVSAAQASGDRSSMVRLLKKAAASCLILGLSCCLFFLIFGNLLGTILFHSSAAGKFILTLAWICPFLYTNTALMSAINGLGKTLFTFMINVTGLLVRIVGVFFAIPKFGIQGYLWGLLASQFVVTGLAVAVLLTAARPPKHHV